MISCNQSINLSIYQSINLSIYQSINMPDVLIRNIEEDVLTKLKEKAEKNNRSLQGELHEILKEYVGPDIEKTRNMVNDILVEYRAEGRTFSDSAEDLREDRDR
ncbi:MAG: hypothetical protein BalsKO_17420 [Balneolaceae bacterium]